MIAPQSVDSALLTHHPEDGQWESIVGAMKPGAHLLLFSNVKEHHSGTIAAEDNGLEIRDTVAYAFAEGESVGGKVGMQFVTLARKPLCGTVAENVLRYGTGGLNIDGCRVLTSESTVRVNNTSLGSSGSGIYGKGGPCTGGSSSGRWPANLTHCGSPDVQSMFPNGGAHGGKGIFKQHTWTGRDLTPQLIDRSSGNASRFFYSAPCLNDLLSYLVKLVTPFSGTVLVDCNTVNLPNDYSYVQL